MDHPYEDLAEYVDGSLFDEDLARVQAHLSSCPSCAAEIESASVARDALRQLDEIAQPDGLVARAKRQVTGPSPIDQAEPASGAQSQASAGARTRRWASASLAAAAVIAVLFVGGTMVKQQQRTTELSQQIAALPSPAAGTSTAGGEQTAALQDLAIAERDRYASLSNGRFTSSSLAPAPSETATDSAAQPESATTADETGKQAPGALGLEEAHGAAATRCLRASGSGPGELLRIYRGEIEGTPSYFGVYLEGSEPTAQPDRIAVWVASQSDCEVLGYSQAYLIYPSPSPAPEGFDWPSP